MPLTSGRVKVPTKISDGDAEQAKAEPGKGYLGNRVSLAGLGAGGSLLGNSENKAGEARRVFPLH